MATKTKKAPKPRARKPKVKQPYLETPEGTMAPPSIPALDNAAEKYVLARDERMDLLKDEIKAHEALLDAMKDAKLTSYSFDGSVVTVVSTTKVKVSRKGGEANGEA